MSRVLNKQPCFKVYSRHFEKCSEAKGFLDNFSSLFMRRLYLFFTKNIFFYVYKEES